MVQAKRRKNEVITQFMEELTTATKFLEKSREVVFYCDSNQSKLLDIAVERLLKTPEFKTYSFDFYKNGISSIPNTYAVAIKKV